VIAQPEAADVPAPAVLRAGELVELSRIYEPEVQLVWAPVTPPSGALRYARRLAEGRTARARVEVETPDGVPAAGTLERLALIDGEDESSWLAYLEEVTELFASLFDARSVGLRLVVDDGPHCPRFHVDRVVARGVATVLGPGTEWLDDAAVDRRRLGHAGGPDDATSGAVRDWSRLRRADAGQLGVFKGTAWPGAAPRAVVHRSPPADGSRRVVLTFDWLD
jgi:hypothetical protein